MDTVSDIHPDLSSDVFAMKQSSEEQAETVTQLAFSGWAAHKVPLSLEQVQAIYDRIDWSFVADELEQQKREYGTYGKQAPISMCKALALPYLTSIRSRTELATRLEEYDAYRVICGFRGRPPTEAKLWHFQYAPLLGEKRRKREGRIDKKDRQTWFYGILYRILLRAMIPGLKLGLDLPFRYIEDAPQLPEASKESPRPLILPEYPDLEFRLIHEKNESFPVHVCAFRLGHTVDAYSCMMQPPPWFGKEKAAQSYLDVGSESRSIRQYTACSAIVLSSDNKVLLGKRKTGYKPGYFALPGGQWRSSETLKECVEREVKEETGLRIMNSRPVSIRFNRYEDDQQECWSVGALVAGYEGQVILREPEKCESWKWCDLDALPEPLFRPSQIILDDYRFDRFGNITWEQTENWIEKTKQDKIEPIPIAQLQLPL